MNFHSPLAGLLVIPPGTPRVCINSRAYVHTQGRLLEKEEEEEEEEKEREVERGLLVRAELRQPAVFFSFYFYFSPIDRQNVNARISQTAENASNLYSTKMTSDYPPHRLLRLALQSHAQMAGILLKQKAPMFRVELRTVNCPVFPDYQVLSSRVG